MKHIPLVLSVKRKIRVRMTASMFGVPFWIRVRNVWRSLLSRILWNAHKCKVKTVTLTTILWLFILAYGITVPHAVSLFEVQVSLHIDICDSYLCLILKFISFFIIGVPHCQCLCFCLIYLKVMGGVSIAYQQITKTRWQLFTCEPVYDIHIIA